MNSRNALNSTSLMTSTSKSNPFRYSNKFLSNHELLTLQVDFPLLHHWVLVFEKLFTREGGETTNSFWQLLRVRWMGYLRWSLVFRVGYSGKLPPKSESWSRFGRSRPEQKIRIKVSYSKSIAFRISEDRIVRFAEVYLEALLFEMKCDFTTR